ncbi:hypothetical protein B0T25DRAFT_247247 [Lasiosphaeria hispida]|uniref:Heterokaryon incompatibility domain-containing protein n=1 Tax=Lasiosphaeria hispida TaxID=260671 RepID=A0AAJ0HF28_9PEZI|nr:hypothetical protein B0T25DRAFT_247247 [Lasiosphaeria hispida]
MERWQDDDSKLSLDEISRHHAKSIVQAILEIGQQTASQTSFTPFLERLECLLLPDSVDRQSQAVIGLPRKSIDITEIRRKPKFIALSYTWDASPDEEDASGRYHIEDREQPGQFRASETRDCVFERVIKYGRSAGVNVKLLWIDRHCITQDAERNGCKETSCSDDRCIHNRSGMQVMDLVYKHSSHPVALLGRPVESASDIDRLAELLKGNITRLNNNEEPRLSISADEIWPVLSMLSNIIHDVWWQRAWPFQENFLAGGKMILLIKHARKLEGHKRLHSPSIFGQVDGELCISSAKFSVKITQFCTALRGYLNHDENRLSNFSAEEKEELEKTITCLIKTAGRYSVLLDPSRSMMPAIVHDVEKRGIANCWDKLPIVANCCQYMTRLDQEQLKENGHSLSLSMLAMCLLNGEVPDNARRGNLSGLTVSEYLRRGFLHNFQGPSVYEYLSFNKGCRLHRVTLRREGVQTKGHLWKLREIIDTSEISPERRMAWVKHPAGGLAWLRDTLRFEGHLPLAEEISKFLKRESDSRISRQGSRQHSTFASNHQHVIGQELAEAISQGKRLRLGCIYGPLDKGTPSMAVFIWDPEPRAEVNYSSDGDEEMTGVDSTDTTSHGCDGRSPTFVFTSFKEDEGRIVDDAAIKDLDRHVSLEVEVEDNEAVPQLRIKRWIWGLCFFRKCLLIDVIFPWPSDLVGSVR